MKKIIILISLIFCFSGCASTQSLIVKPVKFDNGITDRQILSYSGDLKMMCANVIYGGTSLRFASTVIGRGAGIATGILGVAGEASREALGILSLVSSGNYEAQSIFAAKAKAAVCVYGLQRVEKAELQYAEELLKTGEDGELTSAGLKLYETIINTKKVMVKMLMGQVPEKGEL